MHTLGLDPSLRGFGWCVHDSCGVGETRVIARGVWSTSSKSIWVERYVALRREVGSLLETYGQIEAVGVESPPYGEQYSEGLYALFLMVNEAIWERRRDVVYFDPGTAKMLVKEDPRARPGKMFKSDMIEAARVDTQIRRWNHNEADAYHIARFAARFWQLVRGDITEVDLTPAEQRAFSGVHTFTRGKRAGQTVRSGALFKEGKRFFRFSALPVGTPKA